MTTAGRIAAVALALSSGATSGPADAAEPRTKVILNGKATAVTFNDGDSFRVLGGSSEGAKARLKGYNTLESYGPVHQWGTWTAKELYTIAKMATLFARRGVWECESDGKVDGYGRMLVWCPKLAEEMLRRGYAHGMTVTDDPSPPELLAAQHEAQAAHRGIWAHGIPPFIVTSLHSAEEDVSGHGTYNRMVSTADGHSVKWKHDDRYSECQKVCNKIYDVDDARVDDVTQRLASVPELTPIIGNLSPEDLRSVVKDFARLRIINRKIAPDDRQKLHDFLEEWAANGDFGPQQGKDSACMIHVPFKRRYGAGRASCLH